MKDHHKTIFENWARGKYATGLFTESSFISILHETDVWTEELYWQLDKAFFMLGADGEGAIKDRNLTFAITDIFIYVHGRLAYHRMPSDCSKINGFDDDACHDWAERLEGAFRVALYAEPLKNEHFELVNPLL